MFLDCTSTPTVGSSKKSTSGVCSIPATKLIRRFIPPEK